MAKTPALTVNLKITGVRETLALFNGLPAAASVELRAASLRLAELMAARAKAAAVADNKQSALMAPTIKPVRDRLPTVQAGGTKRVGRNKKPAYKILFGSEFGSSRLNQFRPHRGRNSYWFFASVEANQALIDKQWNRAADKIVLAWNAKAAVTQIINMSGAA